MITVNGCTGPITTFLIEPFVPHTHEFYLSITSTRNGWEVSFSEAGGIHIGKGAVRRQCAVTGATRRS